MTEPGAHIGRVVSVEGAEAVVRFARGMACAHCGACLTLSDGNMETRVKNTLSAAVGDHVEVRLAANRVVSATLLAYGVPLVALLAGLAVGSRISDIAAMGLGLLFCAIAYLVLHLLERRWKERETYRPTMIRVLTNEEE